MMNRLSFSFLLMCALVPPGAASEPGTHALVDSRPGTLPLILTAPHNGDQRPDSAPLRRHGETVRDVRTAQLALDVARRLEEKLGARPAVVLARFSRKYADANRTEQEAVDAPEALPAYRAYHAQITRHVEQARAQFGNGVLLIDLHGQGQEINTLFIGTRDARTVRQLVQRHGIGALYGAGSLAGELATLGYRVFPLGVPPAREDRRFQGGHTVFLYGSQNPAGVDAIQLELGTTLRNTPGLASDLADALIAFMRTYQIWPR